MLKQIGTRFDNFALTDSAGVLAIAAPKVQKDYITVEADSFLDGTTPPDTVELIVSTGKIPVRQFSGATDQDAIIEFQLPLDITAGSTIKFKFLGVVTNATAPATGETIIMGLQGVSVGDSELINKANGTAVKVTYTAPADLAQYDIINSSLSTAVTVTDLVGGEWCKLLLTRDTADTYAQKIGINSLQLEISRTVLAA